MYYCKTTKKHCPVGLSCVNLLTLMVVIEAGGFVVVAEESTLGSLCVFIIHSLVSR